MKHGIVESSVTHADAVVAGLLLSLADGQFDHPRIDSGLEALLEDGGDCESRRSGN